MKIGNNKEQYHSLGARMTIWEPLISPESFKDLFLK